MFEGNFEYKMTRKLRDPRGLAWNSAKQIKLITVLKQSIEAKYRLILLSMAFAS